MNKIQYTEQFNKQSLFFFQNFTMPPLWSERTSFRWSRSLSNSSDDFEDNPRNSVISARKLRFLLSSLSALIRPKSDVSVIARATASALALSSSLSSLHPYCPLAFSSACRCRGVPYDRRRDMFVLCTPRVPVVFILYENILHVKVTA